MYIQGFIVPVPADKQDAYREVAEKFWPIARDNGAIEHVEAWGVDTPKGERTSFPRSVEATDDETVVFSFVEWPDEATRNEGWKKVMEDERMKPDFANMPFDGKRMFWGGFSPIVAKQAKTSEPA